MVRVQHDSNHRWSVAVKILCDTGTLDSCNVNVPTENHSCMAVCEDKHDAIRNFQNNVI